MSYGRFNEALAYNKGSLAAVTDDGDVALVVRYVGDEDSATITVAADGNITFKHGDAASEANDTSIGGDADSGATIDVSETTEDTLGEVADLINSSPNWKCYIKDALRTDSANDTLLAMAEATISPNEDKSLYKDTTVALNIARSISLQDNLGETDVSTVARVYGMTGVSTYASGTSKFQIYKITMDKYGVITDETKIFEEATGATTVSADATIGDDGIAPADAELGYKLLARIVNSAAMASASLQVDTSYFNALHA